MSAILCSVFVSLYLGGLDGSTSSMPGLGSVVADFELKDFEGIGHRLQEFRSDRLLVLAFMRADCPVAELYGSTLARLAEDYKSRRVAFLGIDPEDLDTPADIRQLVTRHGIRFPVLKDPGGVLTAKIGARRTPEIVILDENRAIRYRGRIDDQYAVGPRRARASRNDLVEALEELLSDRPVSKPETESVGCPIGRPLEPRSSSLVTYNQDIAPILQRRCVGCHRPGQVGPFSLTTYRQVTGWAGPMVDAIEAGRMPPWHADPRYGSFSNDCRLADREKALILEWAEGSMPEGNAADLAVPVSYPDGWRIPKPDLVVSMTKDFAVPAEGVMDYQTFEVDPGFREDRWVKVSEIRPGNRKVVHHCNVFLKDPAGRSDMDTPGELGSYCLDAMTPGSPPMFLPKGTAKRIPAGWQLVFVVHYSPIGTPEVDRTSIGLVFADDKEVRKEVATNLLFDPDLHIPPRDPDYQVVRSRRFEDDVLLLAMFPHMHLRGKSFRYEALYPDGREEILLNVPRYDLRWQNRYELAEPKLLPAGTTLRCVAHFDNSSNNRDNPNPDVEVRTGKQSWEEMFNGYYDIVLADEDLTRPKALGRSIQLAARKSLRTVGQAAGLLCLISAWFLWKRIGRRSIA